MRNDRWSLFRTLTYAVAVLVSAIGWATDLPDPAAYMADLLDESQTIPAADKQRALETLEAELASDSVRVAPESMSAGRHSVLLKRIDRFVQIFPIGPCGTDLQREAKHIRFREEVRMILQTPVYFSYGDSAAKDRQLDELATSIKDQVKQRYTAQLSPALLADVETRIEERVRRLRDNDIVPGFKGPVSEDLFESLLQGIAAEAEDRWPGGTSQDESADVGIGFSGAMQAAREQAFANRIYVFAAGGLTDTVTEWGRAALAGPLQDAGWYEGTRSSEEQELLRQAAEEWRQIQIQQQQDMIESDLLRAQAYKTQMDLEVPVLNTLPEE
jgi:hypothetical protein